ncbi:MAG: cell division protein FtsZ [Bifidobacteriaceae bacterium]|nr:cell division protein FtsZ [Bifidobacteriaceae bacterium]
MTELAGNETFSDKTIIKVVGVGGGGGNAVNRMVAQGLQGVEFVAINTDAKDLMRSDADVKISLNDASSRGLGAGADPEKGAKAAQDHQSDIEQVLKDADMVFVTCGEGGGTGTGASPIVARAARQQGALTVAVVTRPFSFEGPRRDASARLGIENLRKEVDALIVIPNDRLLEVSDHKVSVLEAFQTADTALLAGVRGITDIIMSSSYIQTDFSDIKAILTDAGTALFGIGSARGEDRATQAAEIAISSPLLEEGIDGAHGALIHFTGSSDMTLDEINEASELIRGVLHPEAQIIMGLTYDDTSGDEIQVTVIAAGFDNEKTTKNSEDQKETVNQTLVSEETTSVQPQESEADASSAQSSAPAGNDLLNHEVVSANDGDIDIPFFLR